MNLYELPDDVIDKVARHLEAICVLVDLPFAAADALVDALDSVLEEVHG